MVLGRLLARYELALKRAPAVTTGLVSGGIGFTGDSLAQAAEARRAPGGRLEWDRRRSFAFTAYSAVWGGCFFRPWMHLLGRQFPDKGAIHLACKTGLQHLFWNPFVYLPTFYVGVGLLRGDGQARIWEKARRGYWEMLVYIWKLWIPLTVGIFAFVPVRHQTATAMLANLVWNMLLSLLYESQQKALPADAEAASA